MAAKSAASAPNRERPSTPERRRFALTGPSRPFDLRQNAARRDLAEIDLAGRWFAPHYAVPLALTCGLGGADLLAAASDHAPRISQLLPGEDFAVVETSGVWAWGFSTHDHYVGYVRTDALSKAGVATHVVVERAALLLSEPSSRAGVRAHLPMGSRLAGEIEGEFLRTDAGFVPAAQVRQATQPVADPVALAGRLIGTPYLWGGRGTGGIDCSGLVQLAYGLAGVALPRDSDQQAQAGREATEAPQRGDLWFFPEHVVLLAGPDQAIHASGHWMSVVAEPLADIVGRLGEPIARRRVLP